MSFPSDIQWGHITEPFDDPAVAFARPLWNSAVVKTLHTSGTLLFCSLAGHGLARIPYRHADKVLHAVPGTLMVPTAGAFVPVSCWSRPSAGWTATGGLINPGLSGGFLRGTPRGCPGGTASSCIAARSAAMPGFTRRGGRCGTRAAASCGCLRSVIVKPVVRVRPLPTPVQAAAPEATLRACNETATWAAEVAFAEKAMKPLALREHTCQQVKTR